MGFERMCAILQNKKSNYDTDVFIPIIKKIEELSNKKYNEIEKTDIAMRVLADHIRTLSFAIADGAMPGNEGRSYVLRRILRRGLRYARQLGFNEPIMYKLVQVLVDTMGQHYKELIAAQNQIEKIIKAEEESFLHTMERGIEQIEVIIKNLLSCHAVLDTASLQIPQQVRDDKLAPIITGDDAFLLYDTFGFPLDLTELIAREHNIKVDIDGFDKKMTEQKERSRSARKQTSQEIVLPNIDAVTEFVGYGLDKYELDMPVDAKVLYAKNNLIVVDKTPLYSESGGQVSDIGYVF